MQPTIVFLKSHVKGHVRKDGVVVKDYDTKVQKKAEEPSFKLPYMKHLVCKDAEKAGFTVKRSPQFIRVFKLDGSKLDKGIIIYPDGKAVAIGGDGKEMEFGYQWREALGLDGAPKKAAKPAYDPDDYDDEGYQKPMHSKAPHQFGLFGFGASKWGGSSSFEKKPEVPPEGYHPKANDNGQQVPIKKLSTATPVESFSDPKAVATVLPGGEVPAELHGVAFEPWADAPTDTFGWADVEGQIELDEPEFDEVPGMKVGAGVIVQEPDGRVWVCHPTNAYGGYKASFPKGTAEDGLSLQANAIKEAYEESGLKVEITGYLMDVKRTTSVARYYTAKRVGGSPADTGWESQAVSLVPVEKLYEVLNMSADHGLAEALGAGPKPQKPEPKGWLSGK